jgi:hypothetical protein
MSEYTKDDEIRDFADRTRSNLHLVREWATNPEIRDRVGAYQMKSYEFTQLINSMLGLLVFPQQKYFKRIPETPLAELAAEGWPEPLLTGEFKKVSNLRELMTVLRNSIAHCNIEFLSEGGRLSGVFLWNTKRPGQPKAQRIWDVTLTTEQLEELTRRFLDVLLESDR